MILIIFSIIKLFVRTNVFTNIDWIDGQTKALNSKDLGHECQKVSEIYIFLNFDSSAQYSPFSVYVMLGGRKNEFSPIQRMASINNNVFKNITVVV